MASTDRTAILTMVILLTASAAAISDSHTSFYDVVQSNGLPMGLFPKGISEYSVDPLSGAFELRMLSASPCDAKFETPLRYQCNITGRLSYGQVSDISGVAAQDLFLWLPVKSIRVDIPSSGLIYFDVGMVFKQFSLSFFETPKECNAVLGDGETVFLFEKGGAATRPVELSIQHFVNDSLKTSCFDLQDEDLLKQAIDLDLDLRDLHGHLEMERVTDEGQRAAS
ncbi:hypothetical protein SASPL_153333 [Salvia splendens]|uniref:Uncharacterized protein n=1 Tax=Salvia splendens TaxID=180675 RepID=A0A8X8W5J3_SALSN|nr:hypothetical protein SASPL_153333 [Salvia splendens]